MFSRRKYFIVLLLLSFSLACNAETICQVVQGGDWVVKGDDDADGCCKTATNKCEDDGGLPVQSPETDAESAPVEEPVEEPPAEVDTSVPEGTYVGTTTLPDYWDSSLTWDGTVSENEITIIADEFGNISGEMNVIGKGYESTPIDGCVSRINFYAEAEPSGQLIVYSGTIDLFITRTEEIWRSGCPSGTETSVESGTVQAQVTIIDNRVIKGVVPNYFNFEAFKR